MMWFFGTCAAGICMVVALITTSGPLGAAFAVAANSIMVLLLGLDRIAVTIEAQTAYLKQETSGEPQEKMECK